MGHLPVVMSSKLLALQITEDMHSQDYRLTVRVRRTAIIPGRNKLANSVINKCMKCRVQKKQMSQYIMGDLPDENWKHEYLVSTGYIYNLYHYICPIGV